ncbi:DNA ligase [Staphylococcus phage vB_StaM_PB50]|nr:DNA ligase [Staphylococcus phage vB_StaM_PB50]
MTKFNEVNESNLDEVQKYLEDQSYVYYNTSDQPELTDEEFDKLLREYERYRPFNGGALPSKGKKLVDVSHEYPELVGTVSKVNSVEELSEWIYDKGLNGKQLLITQKYDGNSVLVILTTKGDYLVTKSALTRGKDGKGADLTDFFSHIKIKKSDVDINAVDLSEDNIDIAIKCEAVMSYSNFNKIDEEYANPRSIVAGLLNSDDGYKKRKLINLLPLRINISNKELTRQEELNLISAITSHSTVFDQLDPQYNFVMEDEHDYKDFNELYHQIADEREYYEYMIDGLVIEALDEDDRNRLGRLNDRNKFDVALKFPYMTKKTNVIDIEFDVSENGTGRYTPVVRFEPIYFNGAKCERVSIANYKRFKELQLVKGQEVIIEYRNDVLSYLTPSPTNEITGEPIPFIKECVYCGEELEVNENETFVSCINNDCECRVLGIINNYVDKMDIKGIEYSTINKLYKGNKLPNGIQSLYEIDKNDIMQVDTFKEKSAQNIINTIHKNKEYYDYDVLGSLGLNGVGRTTFKLVTKVYDPQEIDYTDLSIKDLTSIKGIADITAEIIINGYKQNKDLIEFLFNELDVKSLKKEMEANKDDSVEPMNIVFSGFRDAEFKEQLELKGHKVTSSVSGKTDLLVTPDPNSGSTKIKKAKEKGINIINVEDSKGELL